MCSIVSPARSPAMALLKAPTLIASPPDVHCSCSAPVSDEAADANAAAKSCLLSIWAAW